MPGIVAGALCAHPPILLTEVGGLESQHVRATAEAMRELDVMLAGHRADVAVVISPHSPSSMTSLPVRHAARVAGDLARFRAPQVRVEAVVDTALVTALVVEGQRAGYALTWAEDSDLDHGVVVPLYSLPRTIANKRFVLRAGRNSLRVTLTCADADGAQWEIRQQFSAAARFEDRRKTTLQHDAC